MKRLIDIPRRLSRKAFAAWLAATLLIVSAALVFNLLPAQAQAQAIDPPAAPTGLTALVETHDRVTLTWDDPGENSITGYQVLRRSRDGDEYEDGEGAAEFLAIVDDTGSAATTYTDTSVTARTRYVYRVKARNSEGLGPQSSYLNVETPAPPPPAAPTGLAVSSAAHDSVALTWDDPSDSSITGYQVLRRSRDGDEYGDGRGAAEFVAIADDTGSSATTYTDTSVTARTRYIYRVKARNPRGLSEVSSDADAETDARALQLCQDGYVPPTPTDVAVMAVPLVVASTIDDYFVLYVRHQMNADTSVDIPVSVILGEAGTTTLVDNLEALPADRYRVEKYLAADPADIDGDCMDDITELEDLGAKNPTTPGPAINLNDGTVAIPDRATFEALSYQGTDVIVDLHLTDLEYVKFYMFDMDTDHPSVYLMNTETHRLHASFMIATNLGREFPYRPQSDMRGEIVYHPNVPAPNGSLGVYRYAFEPWDSYSFYAVAYSYEILAAAMPLLENNLFYYPMPASALPLYRQEQARYDNSRVNILLSEDIIPYDGFIPLNEAEGYGFLRAMSLDERPNPRDLVIYTSLPNDLPRVAGIITTVPQTPLSHVNLRAVQNGVPNAFIRDALEDTSIDSLLDSPVYYQVSSTGYTIRAATLEEVNAHHDVTRPTHTQTPERDLSVTEITALGEVEFDDWTAFGVKAANVAELRTLDFPDGTVPDGFAVPFHFYDEFMKANDFYSDIQAMMTVEGFATDFDVQEQELKKLRKKIKKGTTPGAIITALEEMHKEFPEGTSLRYRSSTNNEDLRDFNGAGLYDSKTQDPEETEEEGIDKSIKGVWASLWNFRAFSERDFHRIDHNAAAMGVLVHPNYSDELANGVAVSFDPINGADGTYYINSQLGEDLITNPEAHSVPEELLLAGDGTYTILATSSLTEDGHLLMTDVQISQLRRYLKTIHGHFEELYGIEDGEQFAIDIEFKITAENILAIKQARPWVFSADQSTTPTEDPPLVTGVPVISGTAQVGEALTADTSGITDPDGLDNATFNYQWICRIASTDTDIQDATAATYTPVKADEGKAIKVRVTFTDDAGYEETLTSAATDTVRRPAGALAWEGELTAGQQTDVFPVASGYSTYGDLGGTLSPDRFVVEGTNYRVQFLAHSRESLWLGLDRELPADFTLLVAGSSYRGSESMVPPSIDGVAAYWWPSTPPDWLGDDPVRVDLTGHPNAPLGSRQKAPVTGYFHSFPAEHDWIEDVSFRIFFSERVATTADALRDRVLSVSGGTVSSVEAVGDDGMVWALSVTPESSEPITVRVEANLDCALPGAICSADGRRLFNRMELRVEPMEKNPPTGAPIIRGTVEAGQTLTADTSGIADADGLTGATFSYQWVSYDGNAHTNIPGATGSTYTLVSNDEGKAFRVRVSFTDDDGHQESLTSALARSERPHALTASASDGAVALTWKLPVGWPYSSTFQILRNRPDLGETEPLVLVKYHQSSGNAYTDTDVEAGVLYVYHVKGVDPFGYTGEASELVEIRAGESTPVENTPATGAPAISGAVQVGGTLTADTSDITDEDELSGAVFAYQWLADDAEIQGATDSTHAVDAGQEGKIIRVRVSFTDDEGNPETLTSEATDTVEPEPVEPPAAPQNLTAESNNDGTITLTWNAPDDDSVTGYQILRRRPQEGENSLEIYVSDTGSTASEYTDADAPAGTRYVYRVKAINEAGAGARSNYAKVDH